MKVKHSFYELGLIILFTPIYIMFRHESFALELGIETKFEASDPRSLFYYLHSNERNRNEERESVKALINSGL